jgi:serine/threonine protein kinase
MFTAGDKLEFGHYTILKELGSGGMGIVFHCRDEFLQREIAIKMMLPELMAETDTAEIFRQEARLAAQLEHPNIVTIHNIGVENREGKTHHYIAMEYLPGGSLRGRIGLEEQVSLEMALEWMKQLCSALNYAHKRGVVHQDIKPDNIFITQDGNLKIGDFGLALIATGPAFERHAQGKGTPAYMSPELCRGEPRDHRSDIYSLGAVFFEMLSGERPFKANGMIEMALKHATAPVPSVSKLRPDIPPALDKMLKSMMTKLPAERLQSLGDILPTLEKLLLEMKVARLGVKLPSESNQTPKVVEGAPLPPPAAPPSRPDSMDFSPSPEEVAKAQQAAEKSVAVAVRELSLSATPRKPLDPEKEKQLDLLWSYKTCGPIGWSATPVVNRKRNQIYLASADGVLYALDLNSGAHVWHFQAGSPLVASVHSAGDDIFCPASDGTLFCLSAVDGNLNWKHQGGSPLVSSPSSNEDSVFITALDGAFKSLSRKDGSVNWTYNCDKAIISSPQIVDKMAFIGSKDKGLHAVDITKGARKWLTESTAALFSSVLASTDSVYCAGIDGRVIAVEIESGRKTWDYIATSGFVCKGNLEFTSLNYCTKDGFVHCVDKFKGNMLWRGDAAGPVLGGITSIGGALYVSSRNGVLHSFNVKTGDLNWYMPLPSALESAPLVTSTTIFQGTLTGELHAFAMPMKAK